MKRIAIIYTGGTISMTRDGADGSTVPTLNGADLARAVPEIGATFDLTNIEFGQFPGPHMSPTRVLELRQVAQTALAQHDGVVIAHGTDTLEESAFLLDLFHTSEKPVVLVGAMRTRDQLSWDGPVNLFGACLVAAAPQAQNKGVLVVMNGTVHAASEVTKTYTEALDTFMSPETGPLGIIDLDQLQMYRAPVRRYRLPDQFLDAPPADVDLLVAHHASDGRLADAIVGSGIRGMVVEALGRGNVPPPLAEALQQAVNAGMTVVITSRCWGGRTAPVYGYEGGGAQLRDAGCIFSPSLSGHKARIALSFLLAQGASTTTISEFLQKGSLLQ